MELIDNQQLQLFLNQHNNNIFNFLKSLINNAKKVNGIAKLKPSFSGTTDPKTIPKMLIFAK